MKPFFCLCLLAMTSVGCLGPRGMQASKPPATELAEPPPPVKLEEVNDSTLRSQLRKLRDEVIFDELALKPEPVTSTGNPKP